MTAARAISVDDEAGAHTALAALLRAHPDVTLAASYTEPTEALAALAAEPCDLLFLDVLMPGMDGLEFLRRLGRPPVTVLLTAQVDHALTAFELGVRDYLLKPVSPERLARCLDNVLPLVEAARRSGGRTAPARLSIKCGSGHRLVDPLAVARVEAAGNFSHVHAGGPPVFASESLKELEERLAPFGMARIHKSHLVALRRVTGSQAGEVILDTGERLPVGRAYRKILAELTGRAPPRDNPPRG